MATVPAHWTQGGYRTAAIYSGANAPGLTAATGAVAVGSDVLLWSGPGRLDSVVLHTLVQSGVAINFYDAVAAVSGGPIYASGHVPLANVPGTVLPPLGSGLFAAVAPTAFFFGTPFFNGLCVNSRSGQVGFTATFSNEDQQFN